MKAPNFTRENVAEWVKYCHVRGVKVYVTVNTSIKNDEFLSAAETVLCAYNALADGVIVTDLALIRFAASLPRPFDVVASTQLSCHDRFGAEYLKSLGATTVVCARECSYDAIKDVASTGVKVESFLHGALCVCQSGQCLFSSIVGGNSGNRGLCAQPCRKRYVATLNGKTHNSGYLLSAHDMCGLNVAKKLYESGATTFKIEGRNRRPEYAAVTSAIYSRLFANNFEQRDSDWTELAEMYNRNMSEISYLEGDNCDIIYKQSQNHVGVPVGKITKSGFVATVTLEKGDGLKVFDGDKEVFGGIVQTGGIGSNVVAEFFGAASVGMTVNRTTSVELCKQALSACKKLDCQLYFEAHPNKNAVIRAQCGETNVEIVSDFVVQAAQKTPTTAEQIVKQLQKSGDTCYTICDIVVKIGNIFIPKSQLNALRREILQKLYDQMAEDYKRKFAPNRNAPMPIVRAVQPKRVENTVATICYTKDQLDEAKKLGASLLIFKPQFLTPTNFDLAAGCGAYVDVPPFADSEYVFEQLNRSRAKIVCHNVGHIQVARQAGVGYIAGQGLNIFNDQIADEFSDADTFVYSYELTLKEISSFKRGDGLIFVDGKLPLMKFSHCPYKAATNCDCSSCKADGKLVYTDEFGRQFEIVRRKDKKCTFELVNGKKLSAIAKINFAGRFLVDFDRDVVRHYLALNRGENDDYQPKEEYTKGRLFSKIN